MMLRVFGLIVFVAFGLCTSQELTFPVNTCQRNSSDYSTCLRDAIQEAWPRFVPGLPEFDFPSLDPLIYKSHHAIYNSDDVHADVEAFNITMSGIKNMHFLFVKMHFADDLFHIEIGFEVPMIYVSGDIKVIGNVGPFRINSTGQFDVVTMDINIKWIITGHVVDDRGIVKHFRIIPIIKTLKTHIKDMLKSEELDNLISEFVNEYWPVMYRSLGVMIIDTLEPWLVDVTNRIFSKVSFSKLFP